jgi:hypothetical protein
VPSSARPGSNAEASKSAPAGTIRNRIGSAASACGNSSNAPEFAGGTLRLYTFSRRAYALTGIFLTYNTNLQWLWRTGACSRHGPACPGHLSRHLPVEVARTRRAMTTRVDLIAGWYNTIEYWQDLARTAERGPFDGIFLADIVGVYDVCNELIAWVGETGVDGFNLPVLRERGVYKHQYTSGPLRQKLFGHVRGKTTRGSCSLSLSTAHPR